MKFPNLVSAYDLADGKYNGCQCGFKDGTYRIARPLGWQSFHSRIRLAWMVFTGKADALVWEGQ